MKKEYQQPATQVIEIKQQGSLLGGVSGEISGYKKGGGFTQDYDDEDDDW